MIKKILSSMLILIALSGLSAATCFADETTDGTSASTSASGTSSEGQELFKLVQPTEEASKRNLLWYLPQGDWTQMMANVINLVLGVTGSLAFAAFTYGGILMVTAQGNDEQIRKGKEILYWSVLALAIIAASFGIVVGITQLQFFQ